MRPDTTSRRRWAGRLGGLVGVCGAALADLLLPPFCEICGPLVESGDLPSLCPTCVASLRRFDASQTCHVCGVPVHPQLVRRGRCLTCRRLRPRYERLVAAGPYEGTLKTAVGLLKYGRRRSLARPLGLTLFETLRGLEEVASIDVVVPLPLSRSRRRERGFNQSELIAAVSARLLGLRLDPRALGRLDDAGPQAALSASRRRRLSHEVFRATKAVWGRRVLLVDDVVTTGATVRAASRALRAGGALEVMVAVVARTRREHRDPCVRQGVDPS